jgi:hypothetical protein
MISLNVEEKCQNCPNFSPAVEQIDATTFGGEKNIIQTVCCREKDFCKNLEEYLKNN